MSTRAPFARMTAAAVLGALLLAGCTEATPVPPPPSLDPSPAPTPLASVCALLSLLRVNAITGLGYTHALPAEDDGYSDVSACIYSDAADPADSASQLNVTVIGPVDAGAVYDSYESQFTAFRSYAVIPDVGRRAFSTDFAVAVDYGSLVVIATDPTQIAHPLTLAQLRAVVDEAHSDFAGAP